MLNAAPLNCIDFINNILISSNKGTVYEFLYLGVCGYITHPCTWSQVSLCRCLASPQITGKMNVLLIEAVLKGYHECPLKYGRVNLQFLRKNWDIRRTFGDAKFSVNISLVCTWKSGGGGQISCFLQELVLLKRRCPVNPCLFMQILEGFIEGVCGVLLQYLPLGHAQWIVRERSQLAAIKACFGSIGVCVYVWLNPCLLGPSEFSTNFQ